MPKAPARNNASIRTLRRMLAQAAAVVLIAGMAAPLLAQGGFYHRIAQGESLDDIARRHRIPAYELARENNISVNARLAPGTSIWIPRGRPSSTSTAPSRPATSAPPTNRTATPGPSFTGLRPGGAPAQSTPSTSTSSTTTASQSGRIVVQRGDSLWGLASRHGTTVAALADANGLSHNAGLEVGQVLMLPGSQGAGRGGDVRPVPASSQRPWDDPAPSLSSSSSSRTVASSSSSSSSSSSTSSSGVVRGGTGNVSPSTLPHSGRVSNRGYGWPVEGRILRRFENHEDRKYFGIDIAAPPGTEVRAARDGTVHYVGSTITAYGNMVIVMHDGNVASLYAFNSRTAVNVGQRVRRGEVIAYSGDGGRHNEPHIHFQMRRNGNAIDPGPFLP